MHFPIEATSPDALGIPSYALETFLRKLDAMDTMHSIILLRHSQTAVAMSWAPFDLEGKHILHSLSKSFTSMAVGFAQAEGLLDISRPVLDYLPEYAKDVRDARMKSVTLRHLLTMSSGHTADPTGEVSQPGGAEDWCRAFLSSELQAEPGSVFCYNSLGTYMLSSVVRRVTGMNPRDYLMPRLFEPLGIIPGLWECCNKGTNIGGWGFMLSATDLAKVGQCILQGGKWNGRQLVPADYLAEATRFQMDNSANQNPDWKVGYGYQFWMSQHGFRGDGAFGQYILVVPEYDVVVATTSCLENMQRVLDALWELLPEMSPQPLAENAAALLSLRTFTQGRMIFCFAKHKPSIPETTVNAATFKSGELQITVDANAETCAITFRGRGHFEQLRASFGMAPGAFSVLHLDDVSPHPYRAVAAWEGETLRITAVSLDTGWEDTYKITFGAAGRIVRATRFSLGLGWHHQPFEALAAND